MAYSSSSSKSQICYYEILNVTKTASQSDIRKAYLKLSLKYHPDKNSSPEAEENFKNISVAYTILSDPEKRLMYDKFGFDKNNVFSSNINPNDIFKEMFGTNDPVQAFMNSLSDPEVRGPLIISAGAILTAWSVGALWNSVVGAEKEKEQNSNSNNSKNNQVDKTNAILGILGTLGGLSTVFIGAGTMLYDQVMSVSKVNQETSESKKWRIF